MTEEETNKAVDVLCESCNNAMRGIIEAQFHLDGSGTPAPLQLKLKKILDNTWTQLDILKDAIFSMHSDRVVQSREAKKKGK